MADLKEQIAEILYVPCETCADCEKPSCDGDGKACHRTRKQATEILELPEIKKALALALLEQGDELTLLEVGITCHREQRQIQLAHDRISLAVILEREVAKAKRETEKEIFGRLKFGFVDTSKVTGVCAWEAKIIALESEYAAKYLK